MIACEAALRTLSPVLRGEGRVRGQWHGRLARDSSEDHGRDARATCSASVRSPQPSPLSTGERGSSVSVGCAYSPTVRRSWWAVHTLQLLSPPSVLRGRVREGVRASGPCW